MGYSDSCSVLRNMTAQTDKIYPCRHGWTWLVFSAFQHILRSTVRGNVCKSPGFYFKKVISSLNVLHFGISVSCSKDKQLR